MLLIKMDPKCVINPATGRVVRTNTKLGKQLLENMKAKLPKSATPKAATPKPVTPKPATAKSATPKPATAKSATPKAATPKAVTPKQATPKAATPKAVTAKSATPKPATPKPATPKQATPKAVTPKAATPVKIPKAITKKPVILDTDDTPYINEPVRDINKYTLESRVKYIKEVKELIKGIKSTDCVMPKTFGKVEGYTVNDIINLEEKIGTESIYGVIYRTTIKGSPNTFQIASKLFKPDSSNKNEIKLMKQITNEIILTKKSRHFLATYSDAECKDTGVRKNRRLLAMNELAHGDLKQLVLNSDVLKQQDIVVNILIQILFSVATFHIFTNNIHQDTHWGNFLYQRNTEEGYYHYRYDDIDLYLKSCPYNMMIYDFGMATEIDKDDKDIVNIISSDYTRIFGAFMNIKDKGWVETPNYQDSILSQNIKILRYYIYASIRNVKVDKENIAKNCFERVIRELLENTNRNILTVGKPDKILNAKPYIIG